MKNDEFPKDIYGVCPLGHNIKPKVVTGILITNITNANPAVVTAPGHGLSEGDKVMIDNVLGKNIYNGKVFKVMNPTASTFELYRV